MGTLIGRSAEMVETLGRSNVDICALQTVSYKKEGTKLVNGGEYEYKLYWMGEEVSQGGVGICFFFLFCFFLPKYFGHLSKTTQKISDILNLISHI